MVNMQMDELPGFGTDNATVTVVRCIVPQSPVLGTVGPRYRLTFAPILPAPFTGISLWKWFSFPSS